MLVAACRSLVFIVSRRSFSCRLWSLSCGLWDLVPWPEMELRPLALGAWSLSQLDHQGSPFPFFFSFNLWSVISFLFPHLTCSRTRLNMHAELFAKMDSTTETCRGFVHTCYGVVPPPFLTPKEPSCTCADREVFLDFRSGPLFSLLQQSSASATSFLLGLAWRKQSFGFTPFDKYQLSIPEAHRSPTSNWGRMPMVWWQF